MDLEEFVAADTAPLIDRASEMEHEFRKFDEVMRQTGQAFATFTALITWARVPARPWKANIHRFGRG